MLNPTVCQQKPHRKMIITFLKQRTMASHPDKNFGERDRTQVCVVWGSTRVAVPGGVVWKCMFWIDMLCPLGYIRLNGLSIAYYFGEGYYLPRSFCMWENTTAEDYAGLKYTNTGRHDLMLEKCFHWWKMHRNPFFFIFHHHHTPYKKWFWHIMGFGKLDVWRSKRGLLWNSSPFGRKVGETEVGFVII